MDETRRQIGLIIESLETAWNAGDLKAYLAHFTNDATYVSRVGAIWIGIPQIRDGHRPAFQTTERIEITVFDIAEIAPNVVLAHLLIELGISPDQRSRAAATIVFVRRQQWQIRGVHTSPRQ